MPPLRRFSTSGNPLYPFPPADPEQEAFLVSREAMHGHPTVPGYRDPSPRAARAPITEYTDDGVPGRPRVHLQPHSHGPGIPGATPSGPRQPGVYVDGEDPGAV